MKTLVCTRCGYERPDEPFPTPCPACENIEWRERVPIEEMACDFCNSRSVVKTYPASDFVMVDEAEYAHTSEGAWVTCQACADLVDRGDRIGLRDRAVSSFLRETHGNGKIIPAAIVKDLEGRIAKTVDGFFANRKEEIDGKP